MNNENIDSKEDNYYNSAAGSGDPKKFGTEPSKEQSTKNRRWRLIFFSGLGIVILVIMIVYLIWHALHGRWYETTNNTYVQGNIVQIIPQVSGTVVAFNADDGDYVHAGDVLVELNPTDSKIALENAQTDLANAVRQTLGLYSQAGSGEASAKAQLAMVKAQEDALKASQSAVDRARQDERRRKKLVESGAVSSEEYAHMQNTYLQTLSQHQAALSKLQAAKQEYETAKEAAKINHYMVENTTIKTHPTVQKAASNLKTAYLNHIRRKIVAPVDGFIAERSVQISQQVTPASKLMAVIPLDQIWVEANFKETQMRNMRIGQPVELTSEIFGDDVVYDGEVSSLGIGTGSAFSLIPAQNASGNWVKLIQRLPVRINFTKPEQLEEHPLRVGLSMEATVSLDDTDGPVLNKSVEARHLRRTTVFEQQLQDAEHLIDTIIEENSNMELQDDKASTKQDKSKSKKAS